MMTDIMTDATDQTDIITDDQDGTPESILILMLLAIDALATESGARMARHVQATTGRVMGELARLPVDSALSASQVLALRPLLKEEARELPAALLHELTNLVRNTGAHLNPGMAQVMAALQASGDAPQGDFIKLTDNDLIDLSASEFDGRTWDQWATHTGTGIVDHLNRNLATLAATGAAISSVISSLNKMGDGLRDRAALLATSAAWDVAQRGILTSMERNGVKRVMFSAVLDQRTSEVCRSLHGKVWPIGSPAIRRPPLHPRCRSMLIPWRRGLKQAGS